MLMLTPAPFLAAFSPTLQLSFNYGHGVSSFFEIQENTLQQKGSLHGEKFRNRAGLGFGAALTLPVANRLSVQPCWSLNYGHQKYELIPEIKVADTERKNYYFRNHSLGLNLLFELLTLENGWIVNLLGGLNLNLVNADTEIGFAKKTYPGWLAGLGFRFKESRRIGFFCNFHYKSFFSDQAIAYAGADIGFTYKF